VPRRGLAGGSFKPLTEESVHMVHQTAMRTIEEVGFEVNSGTALELFKNKMRSMTFCSAGNAYTQELGGQLFMSTSRPPAKSD